MAESSTASFVQGLKDGEQSHTDSDSIPEVSSGAFLLSKIKKPSDLQGLSDAELESLAAEIRAMILVSVSNNGGHLASSLGAVEEIIAMHRVFSEEGDQILFDVGHQALAHKLLTGRVGEFSTLRQFGGIAPFPKREESEYDVHDSGHASDSLSCALGLSLAKDLNGDPGDVAVLIGDAAISGGMAFEALNHIGQLGKDITIVLNDNEMSISKSVGGLALYLGRIRLSKEYITTRDRVEGRISSFGDFGESLVNLGELAKNSFKKLMVPGTFFEDLGITYIGPIDGHSISKMTSALRVAKKHSGPVLIHAVTTKGKGYAPAEANPAAHHGVGPFDIETGSPKVCAKTQQFTNALSKLLVHYGELDDNLVVITAAMAYGTGVSEFMSRYPSRAFDVGIAEEHAVTLASGLAIGGKTPVIAIYSTFLQRAFDQIVTNIALQNLHAIFCIDRAGLVGRDGATHQGLFDIAYMRMIPNMTVLAPSDASELAGAFAAAMREIEGPVAIRYPRASGVECEVDLDAKPWEFGKARKVREGSDATMLVVGHMLENALSAAEILSGRGVECAVYDMRWIKPIDVEAVKAALGTKLVATIEDGILAGGFIDGVLECADAMLGRGEIEAAPPIVRFGIPDTFVDHGSTAELYDSLGLSAEKIAATIEGAIARIASA
ncbi:MAG: 1-deoxy-D-xylulose-5-phosphate synthase, partial [Coriobacteriales bacterium]|nr:1-deoxy-D-xylulose-5-phosphate synthase [Coriobacteriales bacterium]